MPACMAQFIGLASGDYARSKAYEMTIASEVRRQMAVSRYHTLRHAKTLSKEDWSGPYGEP
jgi:hypothetical protein